MVPACGWTQGPLVRSVVGHSFHIELIFDDYEKSVQIKVEIVMIVMSDPIAPFAPDRFSDSD
jgi:hypothetical protein